MVTPRSRFVAFLVAPALGAAALSVVGASAARAATTIDLGAAGSFAVLAGSGITNTKVTTIRGDVGTSPLPAETGMDPCPTAADCVVLTGTNHPADALALQAKRDLTTAYDAAAGQPADASITGIDLGGRTYSPGVYNAASSIGLTGEVTLDGGNVAGSVFIFQAGSSLTTAAGSSVRLINGASACNVFFQLGSAATLGAASTFRGTILAHDSISLGDAVTVEGRLLGGEQASGAGAVTLIGDTITVPTCTTPIVVPPVAVVVPVVIPPVVDVAVPPVDPTPVDSTPVDSTPVDSTPDAVPTAGAPVDTPAETLLTAPAAPAASPTSGDALPAPAPDAADVASSTTGLPTAAGPAPMQAAAPQNALVPGSANVTTGERTSTGNGVPAASGSVPSSSSTSTRLPTTGAGVAVLAAIGLLLLVAGAHVVTSSRRRTRPAG